MNVDKDKVLQEMKNHCAKNVDYWTKTLLESSRYELNKIHKDEEKKIKALFFLWGVAEYAIEELMTKTDSKALLAIYLTDLRPNEKMGSDDIKKFKTMYDRFRIEIIKKQLLDFGFSEFNILDVVGASINSDNFQLLSFKTNKYTRDNLIEMIEIGINAAAEIRELIMDKKVPLSTFKENPLNNPLLYFNTLLRKEKFILSTGD